MSGSPCQSSSTAPLRPILPRPQPFHRGGAGGTESSQPQGSRRSYTRAACEQCRRRKVKCDGKRPACSPCDGASVKCTYLSENPEETRTSATKRKYDEVASRLSQYEELWTLLQTRNDQDIQEIVRLIREKKDAEWIVRYVRGGDLIKQTRVSPETRFRYAFPDFANWPTLFHDPDDPYLKAQIFDISLPRTRPTLPDPRGFASAESTPTLRGATIRKVYPEFVYEVPYHAAAVHDPRISCVKASMWTSVTSDDDLVRKLLGIYFQFEYPRNRFFAKEPFLDDLANGEMRFCSPLLVNAILANAAHGLQDDTQRVAYWTPQSLSYLFLAEAKSLWDTECQREPSLPTIQAAMVLSLRYGADGNDKLGDPLLQQAVAIAEHMELFTRYDSKDPVLSKVRAFTAWSLFSWQAVACYHNMKAPYVSEPPSFASPDLNTISGLTGDIYLRYPGQGAMIQSYLGSSVKAETELHCIMQDINVECRRAGVLGNSPPALQSAVGFYTRLDKWFQELPEELQPHNIVMPHQLHLHMQYYTVLIQLFESWTSNPAAIFNGRTAQDIALIARARLETLIRIYYLRHSFTHLDSILVLYLLLLGSISLRLIAPRRSSSPYPSNLLALTDAPSSSTSPGSSRHSSPSTTVTQDQSKRSPNSQTEGLSSENSPPPPTTTFLLCAQGLRDQGQNNYLGMMMFNILYNLAKKIKPNLCKDLDNIKLSYTYDPVEKRAQDKAKLGDVVKDIEMQWPVFRWVDDKCKGMGTVLKELEKLSIDEQEEGEQQQKQKEVKDLNEAELEEELGVLPVRQVVDR